MPRNDYEIHVTSSVLDRLLDFEPKETQESPKSRSKSLAELKQSVQRDLEWLLNTRSYAGEIDEHLEEVNNSVIVFGLPDFTGFSAKSDSELKRLTRTLEKAIKTFEPRFLNLKVSLEPVNSTDRQINFRIEAQLNIEPSPEPIAFDTILQLGSGDFQVKEKQ
jgi:type VI secretion system protein ImpF